jgi:predicted CXXCH cytochrome family protein
MIAVSSEQYKPWLKIDEQMRELMTIFPKKCYATSGIAVLLVILLLLTAGLVSAQEATPETSDTDDMSGEVQDCAECHIDVVTDWQDTVHATTFHSDLFQSALADGADSSCYECHATGYQAFSGEYDAEGVTCEACHGETPANHPDEPVAVLPGLDVCADCHATTYNEWEQSAHGDAEMPCTACHNPHEQMLRFETTQELCLNCHADDDLSGYVHVTHETEQCSDCHWHEGAFDTEVHLVTGELFPSGHDAQVETLACTDCHSELDGVAVADASMSEATEEPAPSNLQARVQIEELEAEIANTRAQGINTSAVRLMQGLVVGLAFGGIVTFVFMRVIRSGRPVEERDDDE